MKSSFLALVVIASAAGAAEQPVYINLEPLVDPAVEERLSIVERPKRTLPLPATENLKNEKRSRRIHVVGELSDSDVYALLELGEFQRARLSMASETPWEITVVGDSSYAKVRYVYVCGSLCGSGADIVFIREPSGWRFLYTGSRWVS
jgi:hypothetical protein